jgi:hypothetical protein
MTMYEINLQTIYFSNGKKHRFAEEIAETLDFEDSIVIRLAASLMSVTQNILALDYKGNLLWKIPAPRSFEARNPYVSVFRKGALLEVMNWDGHVLMLHPKLGTILSEGFYSGGGSHASVRSWI